MPCGGRAEVVRCFDCRRLRDGRGSVRHCQRSSARVLVAAVAAQSSISTNSDFVLVMAGHEGGIDFGGFHDVGPVLEDPTLTVALPGCRVGE